MIFATTQGRLLKWTIKTQKGSHNAQMNSSVTVIITLGLVAQSRLRVATTV